MCGCHWVHSSKLLEDIIIFQQVFLFFLLPAIKVTTAQSKWILHTDNKTKSRIVFSANLFFLCYQLFPLSRFGWSPRTCQCLPTSAQIRGLSTTATWYRDELQHAPTGPGFETNATPPSGPCRQVGAFKKFLVSYNKEQVDSYQWRPLESKYCPNSVNNSGSNFWDLNLFYHRCAKVTVNHIIEWCCNSSVYTNDVII